MKKTWYYNITVNEEQEIKSNIFFYFIIAIILFWLIGFTSCLRIIKLEVMYYEEQTSIDIHNMMMREYQREKFKTKEVIASYYTASPDETDNSPCITADMTNICETDEKIIACNWLPFNTLVRIDGEIYRVADRMNRRYREGYIDILVKNKEEAFEKGRQNKIIYILN